MVYYKSLHPLKDVDLYSSTHMFQGRYKQVYREKHHATRSSVALVRISCSEGNGIGAVYLDVGSHVLAVLVLAQ